MGLFNSIIKSYKLKKISKILDADKSKSIADTVSNIFDGNRGSELNNAILDLYYLAKKDPTTRPLLNKYKIDKNSFIDLYWLLIRLRFAGHRKGHYIPASTLVFGDTLEYVLRVKSNPNLSMDDAKYRVMRYFDRNEIGEIKLENEEDALQKNEESQYSQLDKERLISKARELMFPLRVISDSVRVRLEGEYPNIATLPHWEDFQNLYIVAASAILSIQLHNEVVEDDRTEVELSMRDVLSKEIGRFEESYISCVNYIKTNITNAPRDSRFNLIFASASTWLYILMADKNDFDKKDVEDVAVIIATIGDSYKNSTIGYWNDIK